ncbi:hypothetical protein K440DRAFT_618882 [Wilcoxina mikolae CBS 423.85]|nr:hypothetical protein K440DRAFT_618882 [Wilcoxina mikolae CBS 423.85]
MFSKNSVCLVSVTSTYIDSRVTGVVGVEAHPKIAIPVCLAVYSIMIGQNTPVVLGPWYSLRDAFIRNELL